MIGGTPQCIEDKYKGVFSYEALRSRLSEGRFASDTVKDMLSPIIRLKMLTYEEMYVLIEKLVQMHGQLFSYEPKLTQEELVAFLSAEYNRVGADTHITPREIIRDFYRISLIFYTKTPPAPRRKSSEAAALCWLMQRRRRNRFWSLIYK